MLPLTILLLASATLGVFAAPTTPRPWSSSGDRPAFEKCPSIAPGPADKRLLAQLPVSSSIDGDAEASIRQTLALYPFCVDTLNFDGFDQIFTENVRANYSVPFDVINGREKLKQVLYDAVSKFTATHHSYGTQYIAVCSPTTAISITYYNANQNLQPWSIGDVQNESALIYAFGRYEDTWVKEEDGKWRISNRNLVYDGPLITGA